MNKRLALILETVENIMEAEEEGVVVIDPNTGRKNLVSGRAAQLAVTRATQQGRGGLFTPRTTDNPKDRRRAHAELLSMAGVKTHGSVTTNPETGKLGGRRSGMTDEQIRQANLQAGNERTRFGVTAQPQRGAQKPPARTSEEQYEGDSDIELGASGALGAGRIPDGGKPKPKSSKEERAEKRAMKATRAEKKRKAQARAARMRRRQQGS